jgi:putative intracellular protease/amidase
MNAFLLLVLLAGCTAARPDPDPEARAVSANSSVPVHVPRFDRAKPVVAVVGENSYTELTDYVVPFGVLTRSGVAEVFALATQSGPIRMFPALRIEPHATIAEFDVQYPDGADYVIVPAVHRTDDPTLIAWVRRQAEKGATIVGVCDGGWVLANAGLLAGRRAVGHWYSFEDLARQFPEAEFVRDTRYLADGNVVTTTGVTASLPVSIALVEAIAGHDRAAALARSLGIESWAPTHRSADFQLSSRLVFAAAGNWLAFWSHDDIEVPIADGIDDVSLALVADAYSRTFRSQVSSVSNSSEPVRTRGGLEILPDRIEDGSQAERTLEMSDGIPPVLALDEALESIEASYGAATADFVALQIEYPRPR